MFFLFYQQLRNDCVHVYLYMEAPSVQLVWKLFTGTGFHLYLGLACNMLHSRLRPSVDLSLPTTPVYSDFGWTTGMSEVLTSLILQASGVPGVLQHMGKILLIREEGKGICRRGREGWTGVRLGLTHVWGS